MKNGQHIEPPSTQKPRQRVILGLYWGSIVAILGFIIFGLYWGYIGVTILGLFYWGYIRIMEKKMETTI